MNFPKVHSFSVLLERLQKYTVVPPCVEDVLELSDYAIQTRYPGDYYPVTEEEYRRAIGISQAVFKWVQKVIRGKDNNTMVISDTQLRQFDLLINGGIVGSSSGKYFDLVNPLHG